ncbi:MAG: hypothetical protein J5925_02500 [Clostridia bacterium]|nr:hypothetical protein [Clostridia bacterium]
MKKLIPAVVMLLVSALLMATASFAWFSMNQTVTAKDMTVIAKSNQMFLLIKAGTASATDIQTAALIEDSAETASSALYPAAHNTIGSTGSIEADSGSVKANWYYMNSSDPADYMGSHATGPFTISSSVFTTDYVLVNTFSITVADGSNAVENLRVASCDVTVPTGGVEAIKVIVATDSAYAEYDAAGNLVAGTATIRTAELDKDNVETVKIYVYWDGNDTDVYTNNLINLKDTSVVVTFTGDIVNP